MNKVGGKVAANNGNQGPASTWFPGPLVALGREKAIKIANIVLAHPGERENVSGFDLMI